MYSQADFRFPELTQRNWVRYLYAKTKARRHTTKSEGREGKKTMARVAVLENVAK